MVDATEYVLLGIHLEEPLLSAAFVELLGGAMKVPSTSLESRGLMSSTQLPALSNAGGGQLDRAAWTRLVDGKMPLAVHRCFGDPVSSGVWMYVDCIDYRPIRANVHSIENFLG